MKIKEVVKQWSTYGTTMCCTTTSKVDYISEKVEVKYGEILIGKPIFMDDIAVELKTQGKVLKTTERWRQKSKWNMD